MVRIRWVLQALFYLILPITLTLGLLLSIVALAEPEDAAEEEHPSEAMDALLEAGEEEGILEESDRELVRAVVEFGDKVVREVMTPRPEIFAVPGTLSLKDFLEKLKENSFSRVPVFDGDAGPCDGDCVCARPADRCSTRTRCIRRWRSCSGRRRLCRRRRRWRSCCARCSTRSSICGW